MQIENLNKKQLESHIDEVQKMLAYLDKSQSEIRSMKVLLSLDKLSKNVENSLDLFTYQKDKNTLKNRHTALKQLKSICKEISDINGRLLRVKKHLNKLYLKQYTRVKFLKWP